MGNITVTVFLVVFFCVLGWLYVKRLIKYHDDHIWEQHRLINTHASMFFMLHSMYLKHMIPKMVALEIDHKAASENEMYCLDKISDQKLYRTWEAQGGVKQLLDGNIDVSLTILRHAREDLLFQKGV